MNIYRATIVLVLLLLARFAAGQASASLIASDVDGSGLLSCSPAPCLLPPTQASSGLRANVNAPVITNPLNPATMLVGTTDYNCNSSGVESLGFYISFDGGSGWSQVCMSSLSYKGNLYIPATDPILGYDSNGVAYIAGDYNSNGGVGMEAFQKSSDGVTWSFPAAAVFRPNYEPVYCWMAVDGSKTSQYVNTVYISCVVYSISAQTWQVVVTRSNDGGATWQQVPVAPAQNSRVADDLNTAMTIGRDGTAYVTWMYCTPQPYECSNGTKGYMVFSKSIDGGNTWAAPKLVAPVSLHGIPNTQVGAQNIPAIAVDNSTGRYAGNLYVVMYNWTGTFMQVQVARSKDGGNSWSKPVPVAPGITHDQFFPWISVSPAGLVGVSWADRRNDPANVNYQAFATISADGGLSFQPNVQLTNASSNPNLSALGDYNGNTWNGSNYFIAAWMDESNGVNTQAVVGGIRLK